MKISRKALLYALIVLLAAGLVYLVFRLSPTASVDTAAVILPTPAAGIDENPGGTGEAENRVISVTPETVQAAVGMLARAGSYSRKINVETFWNGGSAVHLINVSVNGERARLTVSDSWGVKNVLISGGELWIWYADSNGVYHGPADSSAADEYQSLLTYEDILQLDPASITDAGYVDYNGENCIFAECAGGELGYVSRFWISVDTGLLMGSETYDGEQLVYRMGSSLPDVSTPDESIFNPPG
ncbi:MAG: hypothetical protein NC319_06465 [Butyricicoccus sp.]|nr:hypothetical protein [Butyricicoccus sp.]